MKISTKTLVPTLALSLGLTLVSNSFAEKIYWVDEGTDKIQRSDLDGSNVEDLVTTGLSIPYGMVVDPTNSKMYWTDAGNRKIQRADLDGSNVEDLVTNASNGIIFVCGLALDITNSKMYWVDFSTKKVQRANLDGSSVEDLVTGLGIPYGIAIDVTNSKMYWNDTGTNKIQRANLDGSSVEDIVTGLNDPWGMTIDLTNSKIYWVDNGTDKIQRSNLDGSSIEDLVTSGLNTPRGITLDVANSKMYWSDAGTDKIQRSNLDGSSVEDLVTGLNFPNGLDLGVDDSPLAIELDSFTARQIENSILLNWTTASEKENEGFNVYRKMGNSFYTQIASYKGNSELLGALNSTVSNNYTFTDNSELKNNEAYTYYISDVETNGFETKHVAQAQTVKFTLNEEIAQTKLDYVLAQNFPNPFNPNTQINFQIAKTQDVKLEVYNLKGELVKELVNENLSKGSHSTNWDGTDSFGNQVSSGTYFYKISAGTFTQTNKMILLK
ncbi:MAG: T9SS C-terminal target domain-containing protein [Calditrichaeota bacterium]|nr:MAG: T9SS C-terminal target domain-containing protein [Calditrichota bacterium]